jgi:hypothetical protein
MLPTSVIRSVRLSRRCLASPHCGSNLLVCAVALLLMTALSGCQNPGQRGERFDASRVDTRGDITQVHTFWPSPVWVRQGGEIIGFRTAAYFISAETGKGAFVPGDIVVRLYERVRDEAGDVQRRLKHEWVLPPNEAMMFRVTRKSIMGYSYGLVLKWPDELEFDSRQIDIVIAYQRPDGREIPAPPKAFRVP